MRLLSTKEERKKDEYASPNLEKSGLGLMALSGGTAIGALVAGHPVEAVMAAGLVAPAYGVYRFGRAESKEEKKKRLKEIF
jgi:hypothetical protein